jgi:hypothetical protein
VSSTKNPSKMLAWLTISPLLVGCCLFACISCRPTNQSARRGKADLQSPYWPRSGGPTTFQPVQLASLQVPLPQVTEAEYVNDDSLCMTCHEAYAKSFEHNVHRGQSCEKCHGPASKHLSTRGKEPGTILSFKNLSPPQRSEICMQCHQEDQCAPGTRWRTSVHAHKGVACTDCHTSHYNVPPGTSTTTVAQAWPPKPHAQPVSYLQEQSPVEKAAVDMQAIRAASQKLGAVGTQVCYRCHSSFAQFEKIAHPHQIMGQHGFTCATCHDPHGKIRPETRTDLCLQCHQQGSPTMAWHSSTHSLYGVACTDCHNPHPHTGVQPIVNISHTSITRPKRLPMSVDEPQVCFKCHADIYAQTALP